MKRKIVLEFTIPLVILGGLTVIWTVADCDVKIQRLFYTPEGGWIYHHYKLWTFLYRYGPFPAIFLSGVSFCVLLFSFLVGRLSPYRMKALFFVLLLLMGPGLLVNVAFKEHWGRPRPRDVDVFGGKERYLTVLERGTGGKGRSFPSGHASMGFYLFAPYFTFRASFPGRARVFLGSGLICGFLIGLGRMAQGGHFASDVIWSGGLVYLCGLSLYYLLGLDRLAIGDRGRDVRYDGG